MRYTATINLDGNLVEYEKDTEDDSHFVILNQRTTAPKPQAPQTKGHAMTQPVFNSTEPIFNSNIKPFLNSQAAGTQHLPVPSCCSDDSETVNNRSEVHNAAVYDGRNLPLPKMQFPHVRDSRK